MEKSITLTADDGQIFKVEESVAMEMATVKNFFDGGEDDDMKSNLTTVPVPQVSSKSLSMIITYITKYLDLKSIEPFGETPVKDYNAEFLKSVETKELLELIVVANYLEVKYLHDMLNQAVADRIKNKSVKFVRNLFGLEGDFTPDEEEKLRKEHPWAYEGVDED